MSLKPEKRAQIDDTGRLVFPPEVASRLGLKPGSEIRIDEDTNGLRLWRPVTHLAKVYIEPTNCCNLECRTCIRNGWDEPLGHMNGLTFDRIIDGLRAFSPVPTVFFGGFGEPLAHPRIVEMVARVKALGGEVELITNGTVLTEDLSRALIDAGLDMLWVSLDGATPENYTDVRLGAALPQVLANLASFRQIRRGVYSSLLPPDIYPKPHLGIVFVAMKRNIADLPSVLHLGMEAGATHFLVTNVLPYTPEMCKEVLYLRALDDIVYLPSKWAPRIEVPKIDVNEITRDALYRIMRGGQSVRFAGANLGEANDRCPFIESGVTAINWEGGISPCLPLLHSHTSFVDGRERFSQRCVIGNVAECSLAALWNAPEYVAFRERVQTFDFSFCTFCGGCDLSEANEEDCFGNTFPTCGGCLWAQGLIRCP